MITPNTPQSLATSRQAGSGRWHSSWNPSSFSICKQLFGSRSSLFQGTHQILGCQEPRGHPRGHSADSPGTAGERGQRCQISSYPGRSGSQWKVVAESCWQVVRTNAVTMTASRAASCQAGRCNLRLAVPSAWRASLWIFPWAAGTACRSFSASQTFI